MTSSSKQLRDTVFANGGAHIFQGDVHRPPAQMPLFEGWEAASK